MKQAVILPVDPHNALTPAADSLARQVRHVCSAGFLAGHRRCSSGGRWLATPPESSPVSNLTCQFRGPPTLRDTRNGDYWWVASWVSGNRRCGGSTRERERRHG